VFPDGGDGAGVESFPIDLDYDRDNCDYVALLGTAAGLDQTEEETA
jgi:hypothetical protein